MIFPKRSFLGFFTALSVFSFHISAGQDGGGVPKQIDLGSFPGQIIDQVVIPIPAEVFSVLNKVGDPDWEKSIVHVEDQHHVRERGFLALSFGSLVAEGFIAVQAESPDDIQKIGRRSLEMAEALGLENAVKPHALAVIEASRKKQWDKVRAELDLTQQTVRETMAKQRDQQLSELVSLGGWLRGTNVLTSLIVEDFAKDKAELLNQPALVVHFREMIGSIEGSIRKTLQMTQIETGLGRIETLLKDGDSINVETVKQLHKITNGMLEQFYFEAKTEKG